MNFYLAAARDQRELARRLAGLLEEAGHVCTHAWFERDNFEEGFVRPAMAAELDKMGIQMAQVFICLLPGGLMTHWELGFAHSRRLPILLVDISGEGDIFEKTSGNVFYLLAGTCRMLCRDHGGLHRAVLAWMDKVSSLKFNV